MANLRLSSQDYMAVARAMDGNYNNRIDRDEASISYNAHRNIGNGNGVAGTRELANALEQGDVYLSYVKPEAADKIAAYFSNRDANFGRPAYDWVSDPFISQRDLDLPRHVRDRVDRNGDNRISTREFSNALSSGVLTIGESRQVNYDSYEYHEPVYHEPYRNTYREPVYHEPYYNSRPRNTDATDAVVGGILLLGIGAALLSQDKIKPEHR